MAFRALVASCALSAAVGCGATAGAGKGGSTTPGAEGKPQEAMLRLQEASDAQSARIAELETRLALLEAEARGWREQAQAQTPQKPVETVRIGVEERRREREAVERSQPIPLVQLHEPERPEPAHVYTLPEAPLGMSAKVPVVPLPDERGGKLAPPAPSGTPVDQLKSALRALKERRYEEARAGLSALLDAHPDGAVAESAQYWLGEVHYAERRYGEALRQFESLLALHQKSPKRADAMLKAGLCLRRLGDDARAQRYFQQVKQQFPSSEAARMASREGAS